MDNEQALFNIANTNKMKKGKIDNRYSGYFYIPTPKKKAISASVSKHMQRFFLNRTGLKNFLKIMKSSTRNLNFQTDSQNLASIKSH